MDISVKDAVFNALEEWRLNPGNININGCPVKTAPDPVTSQFIEPFGDMCMSEPNEERIVRVKTRTKIWIHVEENEGDRMTQDCEIEADVRVEYVNFEYVGKIEKIYCFTTY